MEKQELQELAKKIQLEIKAEEELIYLETFQKVEKLLANFKKIKVGKKIKAEKRIGVGYLSLKDLEKIKTRFSQQRVSKKRLRSNAETTPDGFIIFKDK